VAFLIHPTVWLQYINVIDGTDRQDRQRSDNIGRTGLQTVAQKLKPGLVASYDIGLETEMALFVTYLLT